MKANRLLALAAAALIGLGAYYVTREKAPSTEVENALLYPDLLAHLNDSQRIEIKGANDAFTVARQGKRWTMRERDDYAVRAEMAKAALVQLASLRIRERKTAKPENYAGLGVTDEPAPGSETRRITVRGADDATLVDLIVGKGRQTRGAESPGHYVRKAGDHMAWLVEGELAIATRRNDWMDTEILNLPTERVRQVRIAHAGEQPVIVAKDNPEQQLFSLRDVPEGYEERSTAVISSIGGVLLDVRFDDVAAASRIEGQEPDATVEVQTFDGLVATLSQYEARNKRYVKFDFTFDPQLVYVAPVTGDKAQESAPTPAAAKGAGEDATKTSTLPPAAAPAIKPASEVQAEVEALRKSTGAWAYVLPDFKARIIDKKMEDLTKTRSPLPPKPEPIEEMNKGDEAP